MESTQSIVRHKVGKCPGCRDYVWADATIQTRISGAPRLDENGRATASAVAEIVGVKIDHKCAGYEE